METKATLLINGEKTACGCGSCGLIFEIYEGKLSKDSSNHFSFTCDTCLKQQDCKHPSSDVVHIYDEDSLLGDSYYCGICGDLTQVG